MAKGSACKADIRGFESHQYLVKEDKYYVRKMWQYSLNQDCECGDDDPDDECTHEPIRSTVYEVYAQPRKDYLWARLYHVYDTLARKTRLEKLQDWVWEKRGFDPDDFMPPSIEHDCKCYSLDVRNQTVIGRVLVPREEGLL